MPFFFVFLFLLYSYLTAMPSVHSIPIVDFSAFKTNPEKIAQDVFSACKSIGFFYMVNHDIPLKDVDKAFELVLRRRRMQHGELICTCF